MSAVASTAEGGRVHFWCPGCDGVHGITPAWTWNGSLERPTFSPSVLVGGVQWEQGEHFHKPRHAVAAGSPIVCHSFVTDGQIQFLGDCTHALANQTVPLPPWPYGSQEA